MWFERSKQITEHYSLTFWQLQFILWQFFMLLQDDIISFSALNELSFEKLEMEDEAKEDTD